MSYKLRSDNISLCFEILASIRFMEEKNRQRYLPPFSQAMPLPAARLLTNSQTDYLFGNLNESMPVNFNDFMPGNLNE